MNPRLKGILLLLPLISVFFLGDIVFTAFALILGVIAYFELRKAFSHKEIHLPICPSICIPALLGVLSFSPLNPTRNYILIILSVLTLISIVTQKNNSFIKILVSLGCVIYAFIPFWLLAKLEITTAFSGRPFSILIFLLAFSTDMSAMISGKFFGKHKLTKISPNKTIEGSLGGIIGATLVCTIYGFAVHFPMRFIMPISIIGSIISQCGDLFASAIKRYCGIKDFSNLIPGHGGVLDRFDSVNFVTVFITLISFVRM